MAVIEHEGVLIFKDPNGNSHVIHPIHKNAIYIDTFDAENNVLYTVSGDKLIEKGKGE